ncbi:MAG: NAD(P)H-hydrate epimerase [Planctomycetes bacterium]|nr:NAD(P)H-hydrate epimerase [Planctomycetota bacterium]
MASHDFTLTRAQSRRVDELAVDEFKMPSLVLMENAGRNAADCIERRYGSTVESQPRSVKIFCGAGNNGGDGFVIARHLCNAGFDVRLWLVGDRSRITHDAGVNLAIVSAMQLPVEDVVEGHDVGRIFDGFTQGDIIVDAMLGTGFSGNVRSPMASVISGINALQGCRVVSIDVPSGLDCDTGQHGNACVRADLTVTFVAAKSGFASSEAQSNLGEVVVADIGAPTSLIKRVLMERAGDS